MDRCVLGLYDVASHADPQGCSNDVASKGSLDANWLTCTRLTLQLSLDFPPNLNTARNPTLVNLEWPFVEKCYPYYDG